jgi:hypothetical protein
VPLTAAEGATRGDRDSCSAWKGCTFWGKRLFRVHVWPEAYLGKRTLLCAQCRLHATAHACTSGNSIIAAVASHTPRTNCRLSPTTNNPSKPGIVGVTSRSVEQWWVAS